MKNFYRLVLSALLCASLGGCMNFASVPSPYTKKINATSQSYRTIKHGTTRAAITSRVGAETRRTNDNASEWETRYDPLNYVTLKVWFDLEGRAEKSQLTRGKGIDTPTYRAKSVVSTAK